MTLTGLLAGIRQVLDWQLFVIAGTPITIATVLTVAAIVSITVWASKMVERTVLRAFTRTGLQEEGTSATVARLLRYTVLVVGLSIAVQTVGIDLNALFAAGAVFAVGLGFAMQSVAQNFVAGLILVVERQIRPGDVLEVDDNIVKVMHMGIRTSVVRTRDEEEVIVPNSRLTQTSVKNYTLADSLYRLRTQVGVIYGSEMSVVRETLERVAQAIEWRVMEVAPRIMLTEFGNNAVNFEICVWMNDPWEARPARSRLNEAIWCGLKERGIVIAFPQLDVHFDPPVVEGLGKLRALS